METKYTKLKDLVNGTFTITSVGTPIYKMWADGEGRFVTSVTPQEGFSKKYPTQTDKGTLDLSQGQLGQCLMAAFDGARAEVTNKTFKVGSNGQTGKDIRYYFDLVDKPGEEPTEPPTEAIPF